MSKTIKKATRALHPTSSAAEAFELLVNSYSDYKKVAEVEGTKRAAIEAWRQVNVGKIQAQTEILKDYLQRTFAERRYAIDGMFAALHMAMQSDDIQKMNIAMNGIVHIVQISPLRDIDKLLIDLQDDNVKHIDF